MPYVNMFEAQSSLSRLVEAIEQGKEREIVIARNSHPAAKLVPLDAEPIKRRISVAKGAFTVPDSTDTSNEEVARLFPGGDES